MNALTRTLVLAGVTVGLAGPGAPDAGPTADAAADPVARFVAAVDTWATYPEATRTAAIERARAFAADDYTRPLAIQAALLVLEPDFEAALVAALDGPAGAESGLAPWRASKNEYLAVHATLGTAQALLGDERYEAALPHLEAVLAADGAICPQRVEANYLAGVAYGRLLQPKKAIPLLKTYVAAEATPGTERLRVGAERLLTELETLEDGSLADVFYRMDDSRRRLRLTDAGDATVEQQTKIVGLLDTLIKKAEDCECKGGQCEKPGQEGDKPGSGREGQAGGGANDLTPGEVVIKTYRGPESPWSRLRDRDRDPAYSAIKEKFPARYGGLLEQYYKSFQDESN